MDPMIQIYFVIASNVWQIYLYFLSLHFLSCSSLKDVEGYKICSLSSVKLLNSGFKFKHSLSEMFDGGINSCKEKGFLKSK